MNTKSLHKLEFPKILDRLKALAVSLMAKNMAEELMPSTELSEIIRWQAQTEEALSYIYAKGAPSFSGAADIRPSVFRTSLEGALSMGELLEIAGLLSCADGVKTYGKVESKLEGSIRELVPFFEALTPIPSLESEIRRCILTPSDMDDHASATLHKIRKEILISENRIQSALQQMIHSEALKGQLQDQIVTVRQGRYCLPVKAEYRREVGGMVHDQSSSGSTVFIEPMAVVQLNNTISELKLQEQDEIIRILKSLSAQVRAYKDELIYNVQYLTLLDFIFAKGKLSREMRAVKPTLVDYPFISFKKARHPLLDPKKVVPIDVSLGEGYTTLVITGPNTGGKTVTLKTIGLLQLMVQSGLQVPTFDHPVFPVFTQIFADIGDEQSIEQSLSTFSSHMVNIVEMTQDIGIGSLVLFDELGAGTDPTEGAALAQSILEYARRRGALTVATTHYSELKIYALSTEGVENASCEFDVNTLMPTYRLLIGIPGKSNAFAISKRLGLSEEILSGAASMMEESDIVFEDVVTDLNKRRSEMEEAQKEIVSLQQELKDLREASIREKEENEKRRRQILSEAREEAKQILSSAKAEADHHIARLHKLSAGQIDFKELEKERASLRERLNETNRSSAEKTASKVPIIPSNLTLGRRVLIEGFDTPFEIVETLDSRGSLKVQAGIIKMQIKQNQILEILTDSDRLGQEEEGAKKKKRNTSSSAILKSALIHPEIDLRGMMTDEGVHALDKYLDDAFLAGLSSVRIIHGKGTGALRSAVTQYLKKSPHVESFRLGTPGEGDAGVSVAFLKQSKERS